MINNNYYYYLKNNLDVLEYILIYSFVFIQNASNIYIYHSQNLNCKFYDNLKNNNIWKKSNIIFIKINNENLKDNLIKKLNGNGGIYIKKPIFILRNIENFLDYDYIFLKDILVGVKNNNILKFKDIEDLNNNSKENIFKLKEDLIFNNNQEDINYFSDIIYDYNFSTYFNIIYNYYFIDLENYESKNIVDNLKDSKINIINLLIYYILGYKYYFDENIVLYDKLSLINKIDKIFYINLEEHEERRDNLNQILNKFNIEFEKYNGFNGYKIDNIKNKYFIDKIISNDNSNLEYAVLLSHLSLIKKLEKESGKYFLIFEDDLCLDFNKYWSESIENIISQAPDDWEIIMLGYFTLNLKFQNNFRKWNNDWSALSYIIKKSSIYKINDYITNDKFYVFDDVNVADNYIFRVFNTYLYHKPLFTIKNNNTSTFHKDHDIYQKIYKNINYLILNDLISIHF